MTRDRVSRYVAAHRIAAHVGVAMFRAAADRHEQAPWGETLASLADEVAEDRRSLQELLERLGNTTYTPPRRLLRWPLEGVGHVTRSLHWGADLTSLAELEKLRSSVAAKRLGWEVMLAAAPHDDRLDRVELERLIERADSQLDRLRDIHLQMARSLFDQRADTVGPRRPGRG